MSEIVMPECMKQRRAKLLNATYEYFLTVLEMDRNEAALRFPMDEQLMWVLFGYADTMLERLGFNVCSEHSFPTRRSSDQDVIENAGFCIVSEDITGIKVRDPKDDECTISITAKKNS